MIKNYLSIINSYLEHNEDEEVHYYDNMKIGYDFVEELNICEFDFIKDGPIEYKLKYDENIKKIFTEFGVEYTQSMNEFTDD